MSELYQVPAGLFGLPQTRVQANQNIARYSNCSVLGFAGAGYKRHVPLLLIYAGRDLGILPERTLLFRPQFLLSVPSNTP